VSLQSSEAFGCLCMAAAVQRIAIGASASRCGTRGALCRSHSRSCRRASVAAPYRQSEPRAGSADTGAAAHTGVDFKRRRGRENSASRPTIRAMTGTAARRRHLGCIRLRSSSVDRPTICVQFFGRFHAHGLPNKRKMPSIYRHFCIRPMLTRRSARPVGFVQPRTGVSFWMLLSSSPMGAENAGHRGAVILAPACGRDEARVGIFEMIKDYRARKLEWFEKHAGLGGWVGTIGAIIAVFVAWGLARSEYLRAQRLDDARVNTEINLISRTASEFDPIVQRYLALSKANDPNAAGYATNT
jgi:hypothetical protein